MKTYIYNFRYFIKESIDIFRLNLISNIFSLLSTGLIFFVLTLIIAGWNISSSVTEAIKGESEISVYFQEGLTDGQIKEMTKSITNVQGVKSVNLINEEEAYERMERVLGDDAQVLSFFEDNPFDAFLEVGIELSEIDIIVGRLSQMENVDLVRDNKEVLNRLSHMSDVLNLISYLALTAVGITTLVIMSHIIRQGIYHHREQINTLELLGAPKYFIALPFYIEGIGMTLTGGLLSLILSHFVLSEIYTQVSGPLPFIPMPDQGSVMQNLILMIISLSLILGFLGSAFGVSSSKGKN
ncbi:Cell division protein FtsX [Petrocella atlantisensis]|uniref:Cell division protein FtsX n=1 Tax=Petrocella atlantisensis TaxID=2173034 RepID=A0A3P7P9W3_9FIRM|nr:permease-like cell division protein FtsX [Petrocella atlantisensis]VDN46953.1 Cell division protein FtsX [Petrocella atlantisensis]